MTEQAKRKIIKAVERQTKERVYIIFPDDTALSANPPNVHQIMDDIRKEIRA